VVARSKQGLTMEPINSPAAGSAVAQRAIPMRIVRATAEDLEAVVRLADEASAWLRSKGTDQWQRAWPDETGRNDRVLSGLRNGETWIVWDADIPAATVTITTEHDPGVWSEPACTCDLGEPATYVHRLITARNYSGRGLGAEMIGWAGLHGRRDYGAQWIRIDVWTTNKALHDYYLKTGFESCGFCPDPGYPSGALFQKPVAAIVKPSIPQFTESAGPERGDV
jgi:GNAT superfamily N-acetyltransferase